MAVVSQVGRIATALEIPQSKPWAEDFRYWADRAMTVPVAIAAADAQLRRTGGKASNPPSPIVLTQLAGQIQIADNVVTLSLSEAQLAAVAAGVYELVLDAVDAAGRTREVRGIAKVFP